MSALLEAMAARIAAASGLDVIRVGRMAGPVRQAALGGDGDAGRRRPARLSRRHRQRHRLRRRRAPARSRADVPRLRPGRGDARPAARSRRGALLHQPRGPAAARSSRRWSAATASGRWYASSAHFLWIGDRTRFPGSAHVEFARGLANPIGIKCGPVARARTCCCACSTSSIPAREPGRITLIARMGHDRVDERAAAACSAPSRRRRPSRALGLRSDARQHGPRRRAATRPGRSA